MEFPITRMRRLRRNEPLRAMVRETRLEPSALILPLFLCPGEGVRRALDSMPGVFNFSIDEALKEVEAAAALGIGGVLLFGLPETKDEQATGAWDDNGIVQRGLRAMKQSAAAKKLVLIADVCLCEYTSHGHCGVVQGAGEEYQIENDSTLELLAKTGVSEPCSVIPVRARRPPSPIFSHAPSPCLLPLTSDSSASPESGGRPCSKSAPPPC